MAFFSSLVAEDVERCTRLVSEVVVVRRHFDLLRWLQGDVQHYLPHEIMVAAWGDFGLGLIQYDIVSALPGVRTEHANIESLAPLLKKLFDNWVEKGKAPYALDVGESGFLLEDTGLQCALGGALRDMRSSLVHGIFDERGRHDCLYVIFSSRAEYEIVTCRVMEVMLPYLDTALRQVPHLPRQSRRAHPQPIIEKSVDSHSLSEREVEIVMWVKKGKTNHEIGRILDISGFTVKNHLQRIFKKLDVYNRTQAVTKFERHIPNV